MVVKVLCIFSFQINPDPDVSPVYAGWANVGFQLAGIFMDFVMGYWTNRRGSTEPLLFALFLFAFGNLLYGYAQACGSYGVAMVIIARTVIGLSTGTSMLLIYEIVMIVTFLIVVEKNIRQGHETNFLNGTNESVGVFH